MIEWLEGRAVVASPCLFILFKFSYKPAQIFSVIKNFSKM
jgi:hypothetical protein